MPTLPFKQVDVFTQKPFWEIRWPWFSKRSGLRRRQCNGSPPGRISRNYFHSAAEQQCRRLSPENFLTQARAALGGHPTVSSAHAVIEEVSPRRGSENSSRSASPGFLINAVSVEGESVKLRSRLHAIKRTLTLHHSDPRDFTCHHAEVNEDDPFSSALLLAKLVSSH